MSLDEDLLLFHAALPHILALKELNGSVEVVGKHVLMEKPLEAASPPRSPRSRR